MSTTSIKPFQNWKAYLSIEIQEKKEAILRLQELPYKNEAVRQQDIFLFAISLILPQTGLRKL